MIQYFLSQIDIVIIYIYSLGPRSHPLYGMCFYRSGLCRCRAVRASDAFALRPGIVQVEFIIIDWIGDPERCVHIYVIGVVV